MEEWRKALTPLTEEGFRLELTGMGLSSDEVDYQRQRARKARTYDATWERTTKIGFRNVHRQEVTRKTELLGSVAFQRVYTMRCGDCGYQYGSDGCDVHSRRCPRCRNGSAGLPTTHSE